MSQYPEHQSRDGNASDSYGSSSSSASTPSYGTGGQYGTSDPYQPYGERTSQNVFVTNQDHPNGTIVLILGIIGFFFVPTAIIGLIIGSKARKEIRNGAPYQWGGSLKAGWIISLVATILWVIGIGLWILVVVLVFGIAASTTGGASFAAGLATLALA